MISNEAQAIKSQLVRETLDDVPIVEKRKGWEESVPMPDDLPSGIRYEHRLIDDVPCLVHTPCNLANSDRCIIYIHGGGLVEGSVITSREWCTRLALAVGQPVISVDYRLAPEHPYPAAVNDVIAVYESIQKNSEFSAVSAVGADSTGCTLSLQLLIHLRDSAIDSPASCFLLSPSIDLSFSGRSMQTNATIDPLVSASVLKQYATLYADGENLQSAKISPLFSTLQNLPPMLVHVDDGELLLDDSTRLEEKVHSQQGYIKVITSHGLWHVWPTWGNFPESRLATQQIAEHIQRSIKLSA